MKPDTFSSRALIYAWKLRKLEPTNPFRWSPRGFANRLTGPAEPVIGDATKVSSLGDFEPWSSQVFSGPMESSGSRSAAR